MEEWNFDFGANTGEASNSDSMNDQLSNSPFGPLLDLPGIDGAEDIFGNVGGSEAQTGSDSPFGGAGSESSDLSYGGNPFAGDNFWNIFAGGVNPEQIAFGGSTGGDTSGFGGGSSSFGGGGESSFGSNSFDGSGESSIGGNSFGSGMNFGGDTNSFGGGGFGGSFM